MTMTNDYHGHGNDAGEGRVAIGRVEELLALQAFAGPLACSPSPPSSLPSPSASSPLSGGGGGGGGGGGAISLCIAASEW